MGDVTFPFAVLAALGLAVTAIGGVLTAAIVALWVENKGLTKRILEREDTRTMRREVAIAQREFRREVEASEGGQPSVRPLAFDDKSEIIDVEARGDRAWLRSRSHAHDPARDILAGKSPERPVDRFLRRSDAKPVEQWSDKTPDESDPPPEYRKKQPSMKGPR